MGKARARRSKKATGAQEKVARADAVEERARARGRLAGQENEVAAALGKILGRSREEIETTLAEMPAGPERTLYKNITFGFRNSAPASLTRTLYGPRDNFFVNWPLFADIERAFFSRKPKG